MTAVVSTEHVVCYVPFGNHIVLYSESCQNIQIIDYRLPA